MRHAFLYLMINFIFLPSLCELCVAQDRSGADYTVNDVIVNQNQPTVFICADNKRNTQNELLTGNLWLRIENNTIWTIRFKAQSMGTKGQALQLPNGQRVVALTNQSESMPNYGLKSIDGRTDMNLWGNSTLLNWLPSNTSAAFKIPVSQLKHNILTLDFKYQWEIVGIVGQESAYVHHTVYFVLEDDSKFSNYACP